MHSARKTPGPPSFHLANEMVPNMLIWLVTIGEPLPTDGPGERLLRTGILAEQLVRHGHDVVWWTSTFDHVRKRHRCGGDQHICVSDRHHLWLLHANSYSSNVSLVRVANHRRIARSFRRLAPSEPRPDVIVCSWPTVELCVESVQLGRAWGVPVVLDVRDLWPDTIADLAPRQLRPAARLTLQGGYRQARYAASRATAIAGITREYVDWGLAYAGRCARVSTVTFHLAISTNVRARRKFATPNCSGPGTASQKRTASSSRAGSGCLAAIARSPRSSKRLASWSTWKSRSALSFAAQAQSSSAVAA